MSAQHIQGKLNTEADKESRIKNLGAEWILRPHIFQKLCHLYFSLEIDLFATRLNAQIESYVSWKPDPFAIHVISLTMTWNNKKLYAFPPVSIMARVLRKLQKDKTTAMMILPLWPTQVWFSTTLQMLTEPPVLLPPNSLVLPQNPALQHPRGHRLVFSAMTLSGILSKVKAYRQRLPSFSLNLGKQAQPYNMGHISETGCH